MRYQARTLFLALSVWLVAAMSLQAQDALPKVIDPRLKIELFAEHPHIVTPTGLDVDSAGRVWAIESNTHFPPEGYAGRKSDRLLVMQDADGDGRADEIKVFADGFVHAMSVAVRPVWYPVEPKKTDSGAVLSPRLSVYVATRRQIVLLHDDDGDLKSDRQEVLVKLDTPGNYPHNGLAGFAFDALGWMFFGFGENLGADYKIIGSDGTTLSGGGEGGNIYRCRLDGSQLSRWATGFWNPHASCVNGQGRLFSVDNDPDSRPPCRLLYIIPGGDYGYRFRNGRKGLHPFTSWNGEIPGTLPMVAGTGEAPSGVVAYEADGFPAEYHGNLFVGSWGDHRIDRFRVYSQAASFKSLAEPLVVGTQDFRPVGLAIAPDGSLFCTDWVSREYKLHGQGRLWRISSVEPRKTPVVDVNTISSLTTSGLYTKLNSPVLPVRRAAAHQLGQTAAGRTLLALQIPDIHKSERSRREALWELGRLARQANPPDDLILAVRQLIVTIPGRSSRDFATEGMWMEYPRSQELFPCLEEVLTLAAIETRPPLVDAPTNAPADRLAKVYSLLQQGTQPFIPRPELHVMLTRYSSNDPFMLNMAAQACSRIATEDDFRDLWVSFQHEPHPPRPGDFDDPQRSPGGRPSIEFTWELRPDSEAAIRFARLAIALGGRVRFPKQSDFVAVLLKDKMPQVRRVALQWAAEEKLQELKPQIEALLTDETIDSDMFMAALAAIEMLDGISPVDFDKTPASKYVLPLVTKDVPPTLRALALRMVSPSDPALTMELYQQLLKDDHESLRRETIRTLQASPLSAATDLLLKIATDENELPALRADAIQGLAKSVPTDPADSPVRKFLDQQISGNVPVLRAEALRAIRGAAAAGKPSAALQQVATRLKNLSAITDSLPERELLEQVRLALAGTQTGVTEKDLPQIGRPNTPFDWYAKLGVGPQRPQRDPLGVRETNQPATASASKGDPLAGRRVFFDMQGVGCAKCHTVDGRGGKVGPDLTTIARTMDRRKLAKSILEPSTEMSPQFVTWTLELTSGKVLTGLILSEESEKLKIGTADGVIHDLKLEEIESRTPQRISLMPEKLIDQMTSQDIVDLLAFLESLK